MDAAIKNDFLFSDETRVLIGCAFEVLNNIGHGFIEKTYENVLVVKFGLRSIPYSQQPEFDATYKTIEVGKFIPAFICG